MDNAVKYTQESGKITVKVIPYDIFVRIDIADTGIGMDKTEMNKVFSRFYRSPDVRKQPGVGIGLYLAREIIQAQKGYIKVTSTYGEETTFSVFMLKA